MERRKGLGKEDAAAVRKGELGRGGCEDQIGGIIHRRDTDFSFGTGAR